MIRMVLQSHPSRVCGLKYIGSTTLHTSRSVTPFTGVWIEIAEEEPKEEP